MRQVWQAAWLVAAILGLAGAGWGQSGGGGGELGSVAFVPTANRPVGWRGDGTGRYPGAEPPTVWGRRGNEGKNMIWGAKMPTASVASPIIVGERIFVTGEVDDLICVEKKTGRVLWIRSSAEFEGIPKEERGSDATYTERLEPLAAEMARMNLVIVDALNSGKNVDGAVKAKKGIEKQIKDLQLGIDKKKFDRNWAQDVFGYAGPTPTSDGKRVYVFYTTGVVACYELDGKRVWIHRGRGSCSEHGNFASPLLWGNRLVVWAAEMRGYDTETGKVVFNNPGHSSNTYGSLFRVTAGGEPVAGFQSGYFTRLRDGKQIWGDQNEGFGDATPTPVVDGGMIFAWVGYPKNADGLGFKAFPIPAAAEGGKLKAAYTFPVDWGDELAVNKDKNPYDRGYTASPLCAKGQIYQVTEGGGLTVHDAATGRQIYRKVLEMKPKTSYWNWAGASASPTLAGKYIYLMDNQGQTVVIEAGKTTYTEVARNMIEETEGNGRAQNLTTPIFEGTRMYYRTPGWLYCIGEK